MNKHAELIQEALNALNRLEITSTYANMNKLLGTMQLLTLVRDELNEAEKQEDGGEESGNKILNMEVINPK